jgi:ribonuclease VapC
MVIDTSAVIAILRMEPEAELFLRTIAGRETLLMSSVSALEAAMVLAKGLDENLAWQPLDHFIAASRIEIVAFDADQSRLAREAFAKFGKGRHKAGLNLGDCTAYALAMSRSMPLLFKGNDFPLTDVAVALPQTASH